jgi:hypothetical protein
MLKVMLASFYDGKFSVQTSPWLIPGQFDIWPTWIGAGALR